MGNVFSALLSWLSAKSQGGQWLLRIEDIDPGRSRQAFADQLMRDLEWLGLEWDGTPVYQSQRSDIYQHYFDKLKEQGLTYPCYCTRADILATQAPHESDGRVVYQGTCRHLPPRPGVAAATRLIVPDRDIACTDGHYGTFSVNLASQVGDFIIRRKDGAWAYQLAVVIDDALMGINDFQGNPPYAKHDAFKKAYAELLDKLRKAHPGVKFLLLSTKVWPNDDLTPTVKAIYDAQKAAGKSDLEFMTLTTANVGLLGHPDIHSHEDMAKAIRPLIGRLGRWLSR